MVERFIREFSEAAHKKGVKGLEFYVEKNKVASVEVYQGELQSREESEVTVCYVQGEYHGGSGGVYVENFSEEWFEEELETIMQMSETGGLTEQGNREYTDRGKNDCVTSGAASLNAECVITDPAEIAESLLCAERKVSGQYPLLRKFGEFGCEERTRTILLCNDRGDRMEDRVSLASLWIHAEAEQNGVVQTAGFRCHARSADMLDIEAAAQEAAREACDLVGAKPVKTGRYPVILKNAVICEMLSMFVSAFGADNVQKGLSHFAGRKGEQIASELVNLTEEPELPEGVNNRSFDDEGMPVSRKVLIKDGVLEQYLYNCEEAKREARESTGNGFKPDYRSKVGISVTNLKLTGENKSLEELVAQMGDGLYITNCGGMFAGANVVTGDFSLISKGYRVKEGQLAEGVSQITVAGNFFDMLPEIQGLANDYRISGTQKGAYIAPSVFIRELVVSGV